MTHAAVHMMGIKHDCNKTEPKTEPKPEELKKEEEKKKLDAENTPLMNR
jgi:hypothetical protein